MQRQEEQDSTSKIFDVIKAEANASRERGRGAYVKVEAPLDEKAKAAAEKAGLAAFTALPVYTGMGLLMIVAGRNATGERAGIMRAMGVPVLIGGFLVDVVKWPFHLVYATAKAAEAGVTKIASAVIEGTPQYEFEKTMLASFIIRLTQTAQLLDALGLEKTEVLEAKLQSGDINDLIGLTLLHTAFASRHYQGDTLSLANNSALKREDCPAIGLELFDTCIQAKNLIAEALGGLPQRHDDELYRRESMIVAKWLPYIRAGKPVEINEVPGADAGSLATLNKLIAMLAPLSNQAKAILPVEATIVGERANKLRK